MMTTAAAVPSGRIFKKTLTALALALVVGLAASVPAQADWHGGPPPRDFHGHEVYARDWRYHHPHYVPGYVTAPPAVVYAPPPPPSGISLIFPLHIN